jgi:hypothetical protein
MGRTNVADTNVFAAEGEKSAGQSEAPHSRVLFWAALTVVTVLAASVVPLFFSPRYYFIGDSQASFLGRFFHYGMQLREGHWPLLDLGAWRSGDYTVEAPWGLFSPITTAVALLSTVFDSALLFMTGVKIFFLAVTGLGVFTLARSYCVQPGLAYVAGVAAPLTGFTMYLDAPNWAIGLMASSLMPWAWWGLRRLLVYEANPAAAVLFSLLLVAVGYVTGTLMLAVVVIAYLVEALVSRNRRGALRVLLVAFCIGLFVVTVYLESVLSASVTIRSSTGIENNGQLVADAGGFFSSGLPTALAGVRGWWGPTATAPLMYITWLLPLVFCIDVARLRSRMQDTTALLVILVASMLIVVGPSSVGPVRWPMRFMPYVGLAVIVTVVVAVSRAAVARPSGARLAAMLGSVMVAVLLSVSQQPTRGVPSAVAALLVGVGLAAVWWLMRAHGSPATGPVEAAGIPAAACLFVGLWSIGLLAVQHHYYPRAVGGDYHLPAHVADYRTQLAGARGDVFVVGQTDRPAFRHRMSWRAALVGNSWYLNPHRVQNLYSAIGYRVFDNRYCYDFHGSTCPAALRTLFSTEPRTHTKRVDLLAVSTVVVMRAALADSPLRTPPPGWQQVAETTRTVMWTRTTPVPAAGGVVWAAPGTRVAQLGESPRTLTLRVRSVPAGGGDIVLSRLAWPGYQVTNARAAAPVDGYLLTVHIPRASVGAVVTVHFDPPGWRLEIACGALAVMLAVVWSLSGLILGRRRAAERR